MELTKEQFQDFVLFKVYDILSDNTYKRFVMKSRENQETWSINLLNHYNTVNAQQKRLSQLISSLETHGHLRLWKLCEEIGQCTTPPITCSPTWNLCSITGVRSDQCLEIRRSQKSECSLAVHSDFAYFVQMLWFCQRLEFIIRVETKVWLNNQESSMSLQDLADKFNENTEWMHNMWDLYKEAYDHVNLSLQTVIEMQMEKTKLV